jgi:hypothetical protein
MKNPSGVTLQGLPQREEIAEPEFICQGSEPAVLRP